MCDFYRTSDCRATEAPHVTRYDVQIYMISGGSKAGEYRLLQVRLRVVIQHEVKKKLGLEMNFVPLPKPPLPSPLCVEVLGFSSTRGFLGSPSRFQFCLEVLGFFSPLPTFYPEVLGFSSSLLYLCLPQVL